MFELLKVAHIVAVSMMVGATLCNGLLHMIVIRENSSRSAAITLSNIMAVNRAIMAPAFVGIVASGVAMALQAGFPFSDFWLLTSILLTVGLIAGFVGGCVLETRLEYLAISASAHDEEALPARYMAVARRAMPIGAAAAIASLAVIYLMIAKPI